MVKHSQAFPNYERTLSYLRLGFILAYCSLYLIYIIDPHDIWTYVFVIVTMVIFAVNHFLYGRLQSAKSILLLAVLDFTLAGSYGFVFVYTNMPSQALIAGVGLALFYKLRSRMIMFSWFILLFVYWVIVSLYALHKGASLHLNDIVIHTVFILYTTLMGALLRGFQDSRDETVQLNEQLRQYSEQIESLATTKERNRIAREIHDSVGHNLTALLFQLQTARKLRDLNPEVSQEALIKSEQLARSALQDVRLSVRTMSVHTGETRPEDLVGDIERLIEEFSSLSDMKIEMVKQGDLTQVQQPILFSCLRIIQEFMTNAKKHGNAKQIQMELSQKPECLYITLQDDGEGSPIIQEGFGLRNMRGRVEEHQGSISISSGYGSGFMVSIQIPLDP